MIPPRSVFFGTKDKMSWIKAPAINVGMSKGKWTSSGVMLNGGAYELSSNYAHRKFDFAWNLMSPEEVRKITRYFDGIYGDELLYYLDPFAMNSNVLPLSWSVPMLAADDAPPLILDQVPTLSTVATNMNDLPVRAATYTLSAGYVSDTVFIPVPDGEGLNIGVVGSRTGTAAVTFTPKTGSAVSPTLTGIGSTNLITNYMTNTGGGVTVSLTGLGTITLVAMQARVSPNEVSVPSTTTNLFTNPSFETPFNNSKLSNWFTALAGTSPAQVIVIGDSISEGSGSSNVNLRWQTLAQNYLSPSGAVFPFIPAYPATGTGWPVVRTGTVAVNASWGLGFRTAILQDDAASLTFTFNGTSCKVMYTKASATGIMSIAIDGGTPVLVNTNGSSGGTSQAAIWSSGALTPGDHTVVIKRDTTSTAGQHPYIQGLLTYKGDETTGVRILDAAHSGWASQHYTTGTMGRIAYTSLALQAAGGAKLAIIEFGTNDPLYGTTGAQFRTNMENIIAGLRTGGFSGSVILLHMYKGNSVDETVYESYGTASEALAASDPSILYVNMRNFMPDVPTPFNAVSGEGMYADGLHPNDKGNRRISSVMLNIISNAVSGVTGGVQTAGWSADGSNSLRVFDEQTATVPVTGPVVITARNSGQSVTLAGTTVTSTSANQTLTLTGSGTLTLGAGWWDKLGDGVTSWFSGSTPSTGDTTYAWTGTANASTSTKTTSVPSPNAKQGFISGEGHSGLRLSGVANISGYSAPSALNLQSISATLTEVGAWEPQ